jgi:glycosyltransferase involved in cell wall biosynthesis
VRSQEYAGEVEILIVDGGSVDGTIEIARGFDVKLLANPRQTGEAGKAVGLREARGDLILTVDSDNVLVGEDWLARMVDPLRDSRIISSQALRWDYRRTDHFITRWAALTGVNDPLALYVGNYDRYSLLTGRWTNYPHRVEQRDGWLRVELDPELVPTMGANGYLVRREALRLAPVGDYFFDVDFVYDLVQQGQKTIALVDVPIRHYFCDSFSKFYAKTRRRVDDFHFFAGMGARSYPWTKRRRLGVARFAVSTVLVAPLLVDIARGMRRKPDPAWFFHVPASWVTLAVYGVGTVRGRLRPQMLDRRGWSQ